MSLLTEAEGAWVTSTFSSGNGNCVQVGLTDDDGVLVRHSKAPNGPILSFTAGEWAAFLAGARDDQFNLS